MPPVLLATCRAYPDGDEDAPLLTAALARQGIDAEWVPWTDPATDWNEGMVVLRSTWDYTDDRESFLRWTQGVLHLANDADVVAWSSDKTYLRDLAAAGVPVVDTTFVGPGEPFDVPYPGEVVVKPSVGAGSRGAGRFTAERHAEARAHAALLHEAGRPVLVQPYLAEVDTRGETALVYVDGRFSHAVRKGAMLPAGITHPVNGHDLFVEERIEACRPSPAELEVGQLALAAVRTRFGADQLYTRVDLLAGPDGPVVVELELVEPSLFLGRAADGAADRLATAIAARA